MTAATATTTTTATTATTARRAKSRKRGGALAPQPAAVAKAPQARPAGKGNRKAAQAADAVDVTGRDVLVPLDRLALGEANVRKVPSSPEGIAELAALIESQGLLQRLAVTALADGRFAVVAGGRRLRAMQLLAADGRWPSSQPVECRCYDDARAAAVSLAENSGREAMHPADQMEAFRQLVEDGLSAAQVAARFGVSTLTVERRLKLARLAPRFLALYRTGDIEPEQLQVLALVEDHAAQEALWDGLPSYDRDAWTLRRVITEQSCPGDSRLARFVGIEAYEARGGAVRHDLFADAEDAATVYLDDPVLLQTLAMEKLQSLAEEVRAEGWGWVDCLTVGDSLALRRYGQETQVRREPTPEEAQAIEAMEAEHAALSQAYDRNEEASQQDADTDGDDDGNVDGDGSSSSNAYEAEEQRLASALDALDDRLEVARTALLQWTPAQMAHTGVLLHIDHDGQVLAHRGLVRPEDRKAAGEGGGDGSPAAASIHADPDARSKRSDFSEGLMRDLTAHRTAALQAALMRNPHVALATLVHRMAETVFDRYGWGNDVVKVHVRATSDHALAEHASDYARSSAGALLGLAVAAWSERIPDDPQAVFGWLLGQDEGTLLELLAYCTARSIDTVSGRERERDHSDAIAEALGVDMADWWAPTAANYLGRVSKAKALEAVKEATGTDATQAMAGMKKADAAAHCAVRLAGSRWLPAPLRVITAAMPQGETEA
ncbi:ParB family protein [Variovorax sp. YR266]|uniref:ParB/RepB/Spo0J family partition protein n=1 Tax=Variovorax sp. YR266 TaxID=1884386 RepID=UPI00089B0284|nr:ParB/RepB/Spo0J family partition protein [Variovorax sp. YR266]SDZ70585.1 ParB family protein [Variovorax sp. YR266]